MQVGIETLLSTSQYLMADAVQRVRLSNLTQYSKFTVFSSVHYYATPSLPLQEINYQQNPKTSLDSDVKTFPFFSPHWSPRSSTDKSVKNAMSRNPDTTPWNWDNSMHTHTPMYHTACTQLGTPHSSSLTLTTSREAIKEKDVKCVSPCYANS